MMKITEAAMSPLQKSKDRGMGTSGLSQARRPACGGNATSRPSPAKPSKHEEPWVMMQKFSGADRSMGQ